MHANIGASTLFAATSGSSVATAATVGTVSVPQIKRYGYNEPLFLGSIAAGGTLGILIPPSINLVIYGVLTNSSVPKLYLAGIIPGFAMAALFMLMIIVACVVKPAWGGKKIHARWSERLASLKHLAPPMGIFLLVVVVFYLVLGCFMETLSMMITTIPIVAPIMIGLGYDPIWLGIVIIVLVEAALITPPVGLNLFVVQSLRKTVSMNAVIVGSLPFVFAMFIMLALLAAFPALALWLPQVFG